MPKIQSPLLGYNNNVRHKNRVFHIQTEDSGVKHPHVITHLFMDGGRILKSVKTSYADHVGDDGLQDTVRQMMKEQHKAMFIALRDGQFDHIFEPGEPSVAQSVPAASAAQPAPAAATARTASVAGLSRSPSTPPGPRPPPGPTRTPTLLGTQTIPAPPPSDAEALRVRAPDATIPDDVPNTARENSPYVEVRNSIAPQDLPPPPAALFQPKGAETGRYAKVPVARGDEEHAGPHARLSPAPLPAGEPPTARADVTSPAPPPVEGGGRYAPARPAAIFGQARPQQSSIFGEDLISDKSLDEVILSYLAEDLETEKK